MIVVPDASVLLKWVLPGDDERDTEAALSLRDEAVVLLSRWRRRQDGS